MTFLSRRWQHFAAMVLLGDGIMAMVKPRRDAQAWKAGPQVWKDLMQQLDDHPTLTRVLGAAQAAAAITWAIRQERPGGLHLN